MSDLMFVYLMRHGEAAGQAPDGSFSDEHRELTRGGKERLSTACEVYSRIIGTPSIILHSPLVRARQTAEILARATSSAEALTVRKELRPGARSTQVIDMLQGEFLAGRESVVLVGHEPLLGDLLGLLSSGNDRLSFPMAMGMLAQVMMSEPQVMIGRLTTMLSQSAALRMA
jgi:phosphohistidine phosphatase